MSDYYTFPDKVNAKKAEKYLSDLAGCPIVGTVAESGKSRPKNCKTKNWAEPLERPDGRIYFQRPPMDSPFFPTAEADFLTAFEATIEPFDPAWIMEIPE